MLWRICRRPGNPWTLRLPFARFQRARHCRSTHLLDQRPNVLDPPRRDSQSKRAGRLRKPARLDAGPPGGTGHRNDRWDGWIVLRSRFTDDLRQAQVTRLRKSIHVVPPCPENDDVMFHRLPPTGNHPESALNTRMTATPQMALIGPTSPPFPFDRRCRPPKINRN